MALLGCYYLKFHLVENDIKVIPRSDFHGKCKLEDIDDSIVPLCK
jgi:hypothetical protein